MIQAQQDLRVPQARRVRRAQRDLQAQSVPRVLRDQPVPLDRRARQVLSDRLDLPDQPDQPDQSDQSDPRGIRERSDPKVSRTRGPDWTEGRRGAGRTSGRGRTRGSRWRAGPCGSARIAGADRCDGRDRSTGATGHTRSNRSDGSAGASGTQWSAGGLDGTAHAEPSREPADNPRSGVPDREASAGWRIRVRGQCSPALVGVISSDSEFMASRPSTEPGHCRNRDVPRLRRLRVHELELRKWTAGSLIARCPLLSFQFPAFAHACERERELRLASQMKVARRQQPGARRQELRARSQRPTRGLYPII